MAKIYTSCGLYSVQGDQKNMVAFIRAFQGSQNNRLIKACSQNVGTKFDFYSSCFFWSPCIYNTGNNADLRLGGLVEGVAGEPQRTLRGGRHV